MLHSLTILCKTGLHCETCRKMDEGREWRRSLGKSFRLPGDDIDFACPIGIAWYGKQPTTSPSQIVSFARAAVLGEYVSQEIIDERIATCRECEHRRNNGKRDWCNMCGCALGSEREISNLAAYVEDDSHGCHHPQRAIGKGWKR